MERKLGKGALALVTSLAIAAPIGMIPQQAAAVVFGSIQVQGNQQIETGAVLSTLALPQGQDLSPGQINDGLQRLQNSGLFETVELIPQGSTLVVRVSEYPIVNQITFEGNRRLNDELSLIHI